MAAFEYKVVPAPKRGVKSKGVKTTEDRFALALQDIMNPLGAEGWDYVRTDTLPCEERVGLTGRKTEFQNMLVFRRALVEADAVAPPVARIDPVVAPPEPRVLQTLTQEPAAPSAPPVIQAEPVTAAEAPVGPASSENRVAAE